MSDRPRDHLAPGISREAFMEAMSEYRRVSEVDGAGFLAAYLAAYVKRAGQTVRDEAVEIAARQHFEEAKLHTEELAVYEWATLDPPDAEGELHPMFTKGWYRMEARPSVNALWKAGRLT